MSADQWWALAVLGAVALACLLTYVTEPKEHR